MKRLVAGAVAALALTACGVKAPPRPPERAGHPATPAPAAEPEGSSCDGACGEPSTATTTSTTTSTSTSRNG